MPHSMPVARDILTRYKRSSRERSIIDDDDELASSEEDDNERDDAATDDDDDGSGDNRWLWGVHAFGCSTTMNALAMDN